MKKRTTAAATALVAAMFLTVAQAPAANASWELVTTTFTASDYDGNVKVGSLKASGYACKISYPKLGYKVKAYIKVTQSTVPSPSSKPVRARLTSGGASTSGAYVSASAGSTSTTPLTSQYLSSGTTVYFSLNSSELLTAGSTSFTVSELATC